MNNSSPQMPPPQGTLLATTCATARIDLFGTAEGA
jgi:hypothetical protein